MKKNQKQSPNLENGININVHNQGNQEKINIYQISEHDILSIIEFDENLEKCSTDFEKCLSNKLLFLEMIGKEYINLIQLESLCNKIHLAKINLSNLLQKLLKVNYKHNYLQVMTSGFQDCFTIENKLQHLLNNLYKQSVKSQNYLKLYSDHSAAIYITLLKDIGKIVKVSKNVSNVIQIQQSSQNFIGQNIKIIMADDIAIVHDQILLQSLKNQKFNEQIQSYRIMIGQNQQGWAVGYQLKIQMCMMGESDLGACAWIKQINDNNNYMQTSSISKELKVFVVDKKIYDTLFRQYISIYQIKSIRLARIAPALSILTEIKKQGEIFETLLIQPNSLQDALKKRNILNENFTNELSQSNLYLMKMQCFTKSTPCITFVQYSVISIKDLNGSNNSSSKREAINHLAQQLKVYSSLSKHKHHFIYAMIPNSQSPYETQKEDKQGRNNKIVESKNEEEQSIEQADLIHTQLQTKKQSSFSNFQEDGQIFDAQILASENLPQDQDDKQLEFKNEQKEKVKLNNQNQQTLKSSEQDQSLQINDLNINEKTNKAFLTSYITLNDVPNPLMSLNSNQNQLSNINHHEIFQQQDSIIEFSQNVQMSEQNIQPLSSKQLIQSPFNKEAPTTLTNRYLGNILDSKDKLIVERQNPFFHKQEVTEKQPSPKQSININNIHSKFTQDHFSMPSVTENQQNDQSSSFSQQKTVIPYKLKRDQANKKKEFNEGSVGSSATRISSSKQQFQLQIVMVQIIKVIQSKKQIGGLKIINFIGLLSMIIIGLLNTISYEILYQDKLSQKKNFQEIFFCFQEKRYIGFILAITGLYKSILADHYYLGGAANKKAFATSIYALRIYVFIQMKNLTVEMLTSNPNEIFQYGKLIEHQIQLQNIDSTSKQVKQINVISLFNKISLWESYAYYLSNNTDSQELYNEMAINNYGDVFSSLNEIYEQNRNYFYDQIQYSKLIIIIQLVAISISTGILTLFILPIFAMHQKKRENILKLFSTVSVENIISMIDCVNFYKGKQEIKDSIYHSKRMTLISNKLQFNHQKYSQQLYFHNTYNSFKNSSTMANTRDSNKKAKESLKKRNISTTSQLPKLNLGILPMIFVCLIFTLFNPFASYFINSYEVENFKSNLEFLTAMDYFYDNVCYLFWLKYEYTYYRLADPTSSFVSTFKNQINQELQQSPILYQNLVNQFSAYENNDSFFQRQQYEDFFLPIFKNDSCATIKESTQNFREIYINNTICNNLLSGTFKKGLFIASQKSLSILNNFEEITQLSDITQFKKGLLDMQSYLNIPNEVYFFQYIALMTKSIHYFFADRYENFYNDIYSLNLLFLLIQITLLILVLIIAWTQFYRKLGKSYFLSKQCLDLLSIETLLGNSYMISFFKKAK